MAFTISGIPIIQPKAEIREFIERNINPSSFMPWTRRSWPGQALSPLCQPTGFFPDPPFKIGVLRWPTGASRWAYGHFLVSTNLLDQIMPTAMSNTYDQYLTVNVSADSAGLYSQEKLQVSMYILPPTPIGSVTGNNSLYMITLVDERYFWWYKNTSNVINIDYNNQMSWSDLISAVGGVIGRTVLFDDIDPSYLFPSADFGAGHLPIPPVLDAIGMNINQRFVRGYDGTLAFVGPSTSLDAIRADASNYPNRNLRCGDQRWPPVF